MWKLCVKFEEDLEKAGIKGQSITKAFDANMFAEEIWNYYQVEKWFPEEKGMRRFTLDGEENLDEYELLNQLRKKRCRLKDKKRKGRRKKPPDKENSWEVKRIESKKKPPDKRKGMLDALYGITVMGKQTGVEVNKSKDLNFGSGNLEILIKTKNILKKIIAVLWDADIRRSIKSFRFEWTDIILDEVEICYENLHSQFEVVLKEAGRILVRCKRRRKGISASDEGDFRKISVARGR
jgi:hypothetical protein